MLLLDESRSIGGSKLPSKPNNAIVSTRCFERPFTPNELVHDVFGRRLLITSSMHRLIYFESTFKWGKSNGSNGGVSWHRPSRQ